MFGKLTFFIVSTDHEIESFQVDPRQIEVNHVLRKI